MNYSVRVYVGDAIKDILLSQNSGLITIGSSDVDTLKIIGTDIIPNHLSFAFENGTWMCTNGATGEMKSISDGDIFVLSMKNKIAASVYSDDVIPQRVKLKTGSTIMIGRDFECMFHLPDRSVGRKHAIVVIDELGATIKDQNSLNGTYVNNKKVSECSLKDGDIISIGKFNILYKVGELKLCVEKEIKNNTEVFKDKVPEYPVFSLSPRLRHQIPSEIIEIQAPPNIGNMPMVNWLSFLPMLVTRSPYSAVFPLTSMFSTFLQKKKYKKAQEVRQEKYENYLADVKAKIEKNRDDQFLSLEESNHDTNKCFEIATKRQRTLWERSPEDDDFMKIRIGKGDIETSFKIKFPDSVLKVYNDELEDQGEELGRGNQIIEDAPILCDLHHDLSVGIIGDRSKTTSIARNMIIQLTTTHSYKDVKLVTLFSKDESSKWEFVKWLPHSFNASRDFRYVANTMFSASTLDKTIHDELKSRVQNNDEKFGQEKKVQNPFYLFVVTNPKMIEQSEIENLLDYNCEGFGIGVIYVYERINDLPKSCNIIIDAQEDKNEVFHKSNIGVKQKFEIDNFSEKKAEIFARALAPVRLAEKKSISDMPTCVTFLEGYGVKNAEELPVWENWTTANIVKSMAVPLGVKANGEQFIFNMMYGNDFARYHGSHGLLAGTNGSGKSEMMQSWILSMATHFSPEELSFVIIDYKGEGMIQPFKKLPHLAGSISNLHPGDSIKRNLIALERELARREALFAKHQLIPAEIREYYKKNLHKTEQSLPIIVLIIDEFADIKQTTPEFIPLIEKIFAKGRSAGIWAIVSTQRPSGCVTANMYSNSKFSWCCRVANSSDSKEMIKRVDAAKITNAGRACVLIGEDVIYEQVQSYWSGAPYQPDRVEKSAQDLPISMIDITGKRVQYEIYKTEKTANLPKEVDVVVDYIKRVADENNIMSSPKIWFDKLTDRIYLNEVLPQKHNCDLAVNVGMVDNPYEQDQYPLTVDLTNGGHCMIYGAPGTGKTTFLQTFMMSAAKSYSVDELNMYAIDFGSWSLNIFSSLPHVGGVAIEGENEKIDKLVNMLKTELDARRKAFALQGLSTIKAFNQESDDKIPYIVLFVDNLNSLYGHYPEMADFLETLLQQGANYGIYLVATMTKEIYKLSGAVKNNNIALQMKDKSEYSSIVGNANVVINSQSYGTLEPENIPGRGLVKGKPIAHEFQTALPSDGNDENEVLTNLKREIKQLSEKATSYAKPIPIMPEIVTYKSVVGNGIALGLSTDNIEPVCIDYVHSNHCIIISEEYKNKGFNVAKLILKQFVEKLNAKLVMFDNGMDTLSRLEDIASKVIKTPEEFDGYISELASELNKRKNANDLKDAETIVVAIDGYRAMYEAIDDMTATRLGAMVRMGKGLNVYFVITEVADKIATLCSIEPTMKNIVSDGTGILVGGCFKSHSAFNGNIDYTAMNTSLNDTEAYIVSDTKAIRFKTIQDR